MTAPRRVTAATVSGGSRGRAPPRTPTRPTRVDFARRNGWDRDYEIFDDFDLPTYVGPTTFMNLPWITDPAELRARGASTSRSSARRSTTRSATGPGARFGPRAIREAQYTSGSIHSLQLDVEPFEVLTVVDAGDANIVPAWIERGHAMIYRKVREVAATGAIPIVLGGDHSITWPTATAVAEVRRPGSIGIVHFDAHADTANDDWGVLAGHGTPMRRLIESGAVKGRNFVQVGLRGYWPPVETFDWMKEQRPALPLHDARSRSAAPRPSSPTRSPRRSTARTRSTCSSTSTSIDPGMAPGTGTPEPGGMLTREVLRAIRQIVGAVELAGMDIVEVSPPYDQAETTAMAANRAALEAISALAVKRRGGRPVALRSRPQG